MKFLEAVEGYHQLVDNAERKQVGCPAWLASGALSETAAKAATRIYKLFCAPDSPDMVNLDAGSQNELTRVRVRSAWRVRGAARARLSRAQRYLEQQFRKTLFDAAYDVRGERRGGGEGAWCCSGSVRAQRWIRRSCTR